MAKSTWLDTVDDKALNKFPSLSNSTEADVVVIGGGLAGVLTSYLLSHEGKKVVLIDKGTAEDSYTAYTTAFITQVIDTDISDLIKMYGSSGAKKIWDSGKDAIDLIEKIVFEEDIDCEFKRVSNFIYSGSKKQNQMLEKELEEAREIKINNIHAHSSVKLPFKNFGSIEVLNQAKFHPLKFLISLKEKLLERGVSIFENTKALSVKTIDSAKEVFVETKSGMIKGKFAVIATYEPFNNPKELFAHKGMYLSYVYELQIDETKYDFEEGLYEDMKNPYHYFRIDKIEGKLRMIVGGEDHRKEIPGLERKSFKALKEYIDEIFPKMKYKIVTKWRGGILEPVEGIPYIGKYSKETPNILVATAFSGNGMTWSAVSAIINTDIILGRTNKYEKIYDAGRKISLKNFSKKAIDFTEEFFGGAVKNAFK